jgi:hypothetical protein
MGAPIERFIADQIEKALDRNLLPTNSPLREILKASAEIHGERNPEVFVPDASNQLVSIHRRLRQMKNEPQFRGYFPPEPPSISLDDPDAVRPNFSKIASGEVIVKK